MSANFQGLGLSEPILRALAAEGYTTPTPIQAKAIPPVMSGRDVLGCAQTGTGKTAAFALPILHRLTETAPVVGSPRRARALILSPTRELANQIVESFRAYGRNTNLRYSVIFGGVGQNPQVQSLRSGIDVIVATPGRLLDLMNQGHVDLRSVEVFVLDEGDQMLDMGFIADIRRIIPKLPPKRQNLMFSATMPREIRDLANTILRDPENVQVAAPSATADRVEQGVYFVDKRHKPTLLTHLLNVHATGRTLVFARTKHGVDRVAKHLLKNGIKASAIHGNKSQSQRSRTLMAFKGQNPPVLVATDVAARGLDIDDVSHVVNYDLPNVPETYVHRIGRTGRAGASGIAVSFCDSDERSYLRDIERLTRRQIPVRNDHPTYSAAQEAPTERAPRNNQEPRRAPARHVMVGGGVSPTPRSQGRSVPVAPRGPAAPRPQHPSSGRGYGPPRPANTGGGGGGGGASPASSHAQGGHAKKAHPLTPSGGSNRFRSKPQRQR